MEFPAPRWSFPTKDQVADYLEAYAAKFELPVRCGVRIRSLSKSGDGYRIDHDNGWFEADNVVVATGTFGRTPNIPDFAAELDPRIVQLHSSEYKNPPQLQARPALVVGASHSGGDIAYELAQDHPVILSGPDTGQLPIRLQESLAVRVVWSMVFFIFGHVLTRKTPMGRKLIQEERHHGAPLLRVKRSDLAAAGVDRALSRTVGAQDGQPVLADGRIVDVANVVWATGFKQDFSWIQLPITGEDGWPMELRGVVDSAPGLYFTGLALQSSMRSMLVGGAGADAEYVTKHIVSHRPSRQLVPSPA